MEMLPPRPRPRDQAYTPMFARAAEALSGRTAMASCDVSHLPWPGHLVQLHAVLDEYRERGMEAVRHIEVIDDVGNDLHDGMA